MNTTGNRKGCANPNFRHGMSYSPTYKIWTAMKCRCLNKNDDRYQDYGGRGISVCERWLLFDNFLEDMGKKPDGLTLERKDNNKGYFLGNCHWATQRIQSRNKRNSKLTFDSAVEIIRLRQTGVSFGKLGKMFNINRSHARQVVNGDLWPDALQFIKKENGYA